MKRRNRYWSGQWSHEAVIERYVRYAHALHLSEQTDLSVDYSKEAEQFWTPHIIDKVVGGIERGDRACVKIGIEFIEEDQHGPFGKILKASTARALRRTSLSDHEIERVRKRVVEMLVAGHVPHEYREYAKLLRKVGLGEWWPYLDQHVDRENPYVMRFHKYFQEQVRLRGSAGA